MKAGLTKKQSELYEYIRAYMEKRNYPPSYDEMLEFCDLKSKSGVHRLLSGLKERGLIMTRKNCARSITLCKHQDPFMIDALNKALEHGQLSKEAKDEIRAIIELEKIAFAENMS